MTDVNSAAIAALKVGESQARVQRVALNKFKPVDQTDYYKRTTATMNVMCSRLRADTKRQFALERIESLTSDRTGIVYGVVVTRTA